MFVHTNKMGFGCIWRNLLRLRPKTYRATAHKKREHNQRGLF